MGQVESADPVVARQSRAPRLWDPQGRADIKSMTLEQLADFLDARLGLGHRALDVYKALWQRGVRDFDEITALTRAVRRQLAEVAYIAFLEPEVVLASADGTTKFLWKLEDERSVESVLIPDGDRLTLCVSSQVGCAMACSFCLTGDLGLIRHLKPSEIANQSLQIGRQLPEDTRITNIVMMGMGEPLHNLDNLLSALSILLHDNGQNFSHRKVTVSTVGLVPKMRELAQQLPVNLAISLNASTDAQRSAVMPMNRRYDLEALLQACRDLPLPSGKRIAFEYVMMAGFNDTLDDAARVYKLLQGIRAKVNLIPYNENPDRSIRAPAPHQVKAFQHYLVSRGMTCTVRTTRGVDISAACGQLGKARQQLRDDEALARARVIAGLDADAGFATQGR